LAGTFVVLTSVVVALGAPVAAALPDERPGASAARLGTGRSIETGGGLVTFELPRGWKVDERSRKVPPPAYLRLDAEWASNGEAPVVELAQLSGDSVKTAIGVERLPEAVDEPTWRRALLDRFVAAGAFFGIEAPATFGGQPSQRVIGELGGSYLQLDFVELDGQLVAAQSRAADTPDAAASQALDEMLDSVRVDSSVLSPVQNALDARIHVTAADSGAEPLTVSTLVPLGWVHDPTAEVGQVYEDPTNGGESFVQLIASRDEQGLRGEIQRELDDFATESFFDAKPTRERVRRNGVPIQILWDGDPDEATKAAVYGTDGNLFFSAYMVAGDTELLHAMDDELVVLDE
jgi:hypothetical protein